MEREFESDQATSLKGHPVWQHVDVLTVHYTAKNVARLHDYTERYLRTGKVDGIWITEEHGRAGKGPVSILHRGLRFMTWVAMDRLSAQQARLVWWGEGERAGGSGAEMMGRLGRFFGPRSLCFWREERADGTFYVLTAGAGKRVGRVLAVVLPQRSIDVGMLRLELPMRLAGKWSVRGVQYSSLALPEPVQARLTREGSRTAISLRRRMTEPLALYLEVSE